MATTPTKLGRSALNAQARHLSTDIIEQARNDDATKALKLSDSVSFFFLETLYLKLLIEKPYIDASKTVLEGFLTAQVGDVTFANEPTSKPEPKSDTPNTAPAGEIEATDLQTAASNMPEAAALVALAPKLVEKEPVPSEHVLPEPSSSEPAMPEPRRNSTSSRRRTSILHRPSQLPTPRPVEVKTIFLRTHLQAKAMQTQQTKSSASFWHRASTRRRPKTSTLEMPKPPAASYVTSSASTLTLKCPIEKSPPA